MSMDRADASPPADRRIGRVSAAVLGISALVIAGAAAGFIVTSISGAGVDQAGRWVVGLTSTLPSGATISGTGIVLTASGQVVTTDGLVEGAVSIAARVNGGARYAASTFGLDPVGDIAVLQLLNAAHLPSASLGDPTGLGVGDGVTAIGLASVSRGTAIDSAGDITGLGETTDASLTGVDYAATLNGLIEFNAPMPANGAGGPLVDASGKLVGLVAGDAGLGAQEPAGSATAFAIPIDHVLSIVREVDAHTPDPELLQGHGAYLGIDVNDSTNPPGALITEVEPGTPAEVVGMTPSDVIVSIDSVAVQSVADLVAQLGRHHGGDRVVVGWIDPQGHHHEATTQLAAATFT
jgi:S1-C subfamily serine protease